MRTALAIQSHESMADKIPEVHAKLKKSIGALLSGKKLQIKGCSREEAADMLARHMMGDTQTKAAIRMGRNAEYIRALMNQHFGDPAMRESLLENSMLESALLSTALFMTKAQNMSGRDLAMAASLFNRARIEAVREREGRSELSLLPPGTIHALRETLDRVAKAKPIQARIIDQE